MKSKFTLLIILITVIGYAQTGINYKAVIKDDLGNVIANEPIIIEFTILQGLGQTNVFTGSQSPTTDNNGIIIVNIGDGTPVFGNFSTIDWASDDHYLNVRIDIGSGLIDMGTTAFNSVPYAKHAETAGNAATKIDDLTDGKTPAGGTALYIGNDAGLNDLGNNNGVFTRNVGIGFEALKTNTTGRDNTALGYRTLNANITGVSNTAIGDRTLSANITGLSNTAIGSIALSNNTSGVRNTAIGQQALEQNTSGIENTAVGENALENNLTGNNNTAIGQEALERNTEGNSNTAIGREALEYNLSGSGNIAIGINAGSQHSTGSNNIFIGNYSGSPSGVTDESNKLYIHNASISNDPLIYGEFDTDLVRINGTLEVTEAINIDIINTDVINTDVVNTIEINTTTTGNANLIPIAYGTVESNGNILTGTGNFTAFLSGNVFIIDVNGTESLSYGNTVCLITPISTAARTSSTIIADGNGDSDADLNVRIFNASGTQTTTTFQFVIYKL